MSKLWRYIIAVSPQAQTSSSLYSVFSSTINAVFFLSLSKNWEKKTRHISCHACSFSLVVERPRQTATRHELGLSQNNSVFSPLCLTRCTWTIYKYMYLIFVIRSSNSVLTISNNLHQNIYVLIGTYILLFKQCKAVDRTKLLPYTNFYVEVLTQFRIKLLHVEVLTNFRIKLLDVAVLTIFLDKTSTFTKFFIIFS